MTGPDILRLNRQSLFIVGYSEEAERIRGDVLDLAAADGYKVHHLLSRSAAESRMQYRRLLNMAKSRLRGNSDLQPWAGDWEFFYDTSAARGTTLSMEQRDELGRLMRLTPYTGVAIGLEAFAVRATYRGIRKLEYETEWTVAGEQSYWVSGVVSDDD